MSHSTIARLAFTAVLLVVFACFGFSEVAQADLLATLDDAGVLTVTDIGVNPDGQATIEYRKANKLRIRTLNDANERVEYQFRSVDVTAIRVFMGPGNDRVTIRSSIYVLGEPQRAPFPDVDIEVQTGSGNDLVTFSHLDVGSITVQTSTGDDNVEVGFRTLVNGNLNINTSAGNDDVTFRYAEVLGVTGVKTGSGSDEVEAYQSMFTRRVRIEAGPGADLVSIGYLPTIFPLSKENVFGGPLNVLTEGGLDQVTMGDGTYGFVRLDGGKGIDCYVPEGAAGFDSAFRMFDLEDCF